MKFKVGDWILYPKLGVENQRLHRELITKIEGPNYWYTRVDFNGAEIRSELSFWDHAVLDLEYVSQLQFNNDLEELIKC